MCTCLTFLPFFGKTSDGQNSGKLVINVFEKNCKRNILLVTNHEGKNEIIAP